MENKNIIFIIFCVFILGFASGMAFGGLYALNRCVDIGLRVLDHTTVHINETIIREGLGRYYGSFFNGEIN